jgi:transglutaminase-like putative cysteine protease
VTDTLAPSATRAPTAGRPNAPGGPATPTDGSISATPTTLLVAEAALVLLTLTSVLGLARLVDDGAFLSPVLACALGGHAYAAFGRRLRWPAWVVGLTGVVGLIVVLGVVHVPETTTWGIPSTHTLEALRQQLAEAGRTFADAEPPAPLHAGYVVAWAAASWIIALTADAAAFRARATFESIIPAASLFVFASALGADRYRIPATAAFLSAALLVWLTQRLLGRAVAGRWVGVDRGRGLRAIAGPGVWLALGAVVVATLVGPHLPGAGTGGLSRWNTGSGGPANRITVSPLVDLRTRLVQQSTAEVFTVTSNVRSYWRLTALDTFDGQVWSSNNRYTSASGNLSGRNEAPATHVVRSEQVFQIAALQSAWLPAAFRAVAVRGVSARYHAGSGTLLADQETKESQTYRVISEIPAMTQTDLSVVTAQAPPAILDANTALPVGFSPRVTQLARQIVGDARTPYQAALRLQAFFRNGTFTYDLSVGKGENQRALERFLFETRRGYCEQFAGAFAAMARAAGLPARVAVGFTPGEQVGPTTYRVLGLHAHAWPEVYIDGYGWVAFEPTPGRGIPNGEDYTGVPESQASSTDTATATTVPDETATTLGPDTADTLPDEPLAASGGGTVTNDRFIDRALPVFALLALLPFGWLLVLAVGRRLVRGRRRRGAREPADRVLVAWREAMASLDRAGLPRQPSETPVEFASRVGESGLTAPEPIAELARATTVAIYAGRPLADQAGKRAVDLAEAIDDEVNTAIGWRRRLKALFDPRTLREARPRSLADREQRRREMERVGS